MGELSDSCQRTLREEGEVDSEAMIVRVEVGHTII